jgi:Terminase small subunit
MSSSVCLPKELTNMQKEFVKNYCLGMQQTQAARSAGYKHPSVDGYQLMRQPKIQDGIRVERTKYEHAGNMTRKKVLDGLAEAIDIARTTSEPASMVAGWREVAKICGYYAPETKRLELSVAGSIHVSQLENMTDDELVKAIIEGQSIEVPDESDLPPLLEHAEDAAGSA